MSTTPAVAPEVLDPALLALVRGVPNAVLAGSLYAVAPEHRAAVAQVLADQGLWSHADLIVEDDGKHRGVAPATVRELVAQGRGPIDAHLIASRPEEHLDEVCGLGADRVTIPYEGCRDAGHALARIRCAGAAAWLALAPSTGLDDVRDLLPHVDGLLIMLIPPGTTRPVDPSLSAKVAAAAGPRPIGVDGGVDEEHARACLAAGARYLVSGRALLSSAAPRPTGQTPAEERRR